jgi:hypothetical protein
MSDSHTSDNATASGNPEEMKSALFEQLVMQQSNMAMMLLGRTPHPQTGQVACDLEAAQFFIDQLEMLESKTKGNLNQEEAALLKQSLMSLRMAFVDSVNSPPAPTEARRQESPPSGAPLGAEPNDPATRPSAAPAEEESRKKFTKKY